MSVSGRQGLGLAIKSKEGGLLMPSVSVKVEPAVIDWVLRYTSDLKNNDVVESLFKWKTGEKTPTFNQVESVSRAVRIPLGYFFLKIPPNEDFPILQYRTIGSKGADEPGRDMVDTLNHMEDVQGWMREYMIDAGYDRLHFVGSCTVRQDRAATVDHVRDVLQISVNWHERITTRTDAFKYFRKKLENIGVLVMMSGIVGNNTRRKLNVEDFRAFTLVDEYAPLIFINANDSDGAKLFSLLHEFAHIIFGMDDVYNDRYGNADGVAAIETLCNFVAAEALVPADSFHREWRRLPDHDMSGKLQALSTSFKCGAVVIARKALDSQYIDKERYKAVVEDAVNQFKNARGKGSGGNYYSNASTRMDNRFLIALDNNVKEGKTQYTDAFRLTRTNGKTFSKLMDEVRGTD